MKKSKHNECFSCKYRAELTYSAHSKCTNPDPNMSGDDYGITSGWFNYPDNFDPVWKTKDCANYEPKSK